MGAVIKRRGEPRSTSKPDGQKHERSGFNFTVSNAEFGEFGRQVREAEAFLRQNKVEALRLIAFPGMEGAELDFGVHLLDVAVQTNRFPASLVTIAGECGLELAISLYPILSGDTLVP